MQYLIEGADKSTGEDRSVIVNAINTQDAQNQAASMNLLVSRLVPHAGGFLNKQAVVEYASPAATPTAPPQRGLQIGPPRYLGLQIASFIIGVCAFVCYVVAAIIGLVAIFSIGSATQQPNAFGPPQALATTSGVAGLLLAFWIFAAGAVQHGLSAACIALRDIARNSFR
jgi:hypothetical protein